MVPSKKRQNFLYALAMVSKNHKWFCLWFQRFHTRLMGNEWQTDGTITFIYGLRYGFQEPFMVLRMVCKNHLWSYIWFSRIIYGLTYGFQEPFMVLRMVSMLYLLYYVWFPRIIKNISLTVVVFCSCFRNCFLDGL